jgi:hypothetical protein
MVSLAPLDCAYAENQLELKPIRRLSLQNEPFGPAVIALAKNAGVSIGVELVKGDENFKVNIDATDSTLGAELDKLVHGHALYEWRQIGELIDVFPRNEPQSVFNIVVDHFESRNSAPIQLVQELMRSPAVAAHLSTKGITPATWVTGSAPLEKYSIKEEGVTLREALNEIAYSTKREGWIAFYQRQDDHNYLWLQLL